MSVEQGNSPKDGRDSGIQEFIGNLAAGYRFRKERNQDLNPPTPGAVTIDRSRVVVDPGAIETAVDQEVK